MTEVKKTADGRARDQQAHGQLRRRWTKIRRNKAALFGGILILIYLITALLAPVIFPSNPSAPNLIRSLERPSIEHPLGTDELGRSILGRVIYGSRVSLLIAIGVVAVGLLVGVPLGLISGYYGGKVDFGIQRVTDTCLHFQVFSWPWPWWPSWGWDSKTRSSRLASAWCPFTFAWCGAAPSP